MTAAELLTKVFTSALFPDNEIIAALGDPKLKEINLPDNILEKHTGVYLTKDRAASDSDLRAKLKGEHWGHFADDIERKWKQDIVNDMPEEWKTKYFAIPETQTNGIYDRLKVIKDYVKEVKEKGAGEDLKTASANWRKKEEEYNRLISEAQTALTTEKANAERTVNDFKINYLLKEKITGFLPKVDPSFIKDDVRKNFLVNSTVESLRNGYLLEFDKANPENILFLKKDRTDVYEGNNKVTLDQFLEKQMEPYIVKNNGNATTTQTSKTVVTPQQQPTGVIDAKARRFSVPV